MSKMEEALNDAWLAGYGRKVEGISGLDARETDIAEMVSHYGPMFTREEVRGICKDLLQEPIHAPMGHDWRFDSAIERVLSRHTEAEDTPTIKASEANKPSLDKRVSALEQIAHSPVDFEPRFHVIEQRLAAIEKRLLADGHSEGCATKGERCAFICTCGHDQIREASE